MIPKKHSEISWVKFNSLAQKLVGKPYIFGAETDLKDPDPAHIKSLDCSELCEWLFAQIGIIVPDGSYNQFKISSPIKGEPIIGDMGFKWIPETEVVHHVGIFLVSDVIEAKGKAYGTVLTPRKWFEGSSHFAMWRRLNAIHDA